VSIAETAGLGLLEVTKCQQTICPLCSASAPRKLKPWI
jgi:hypothetical protein